MVLARLGRFLRLEIEAQARRQAGIEADREAVRRAAFGIEGRGQPGEPRARQCRPGRGGLPQDEADRGTAGIRVRGRRSPPALPLSLH